MDNNLIVFLSNIILLALFIIFLWRRRSLKNFDWVTLICISLGVALLAIIVVRIINSQSIQSGLEQGLLIAVPAVMFVLFLLFLTRIITVEKMKSKLHFDERMTIANAKSARNALAAVYLSTVIDLIINTNISRELLLVILAVSLVVYLASMIIYYYRSF
jgi:hypothetical protein